jgi:hypothetical protein
MDLKKELGSNQKKRIKALAFIIGGAIKANGIKGKFYYRDGFKAGNELFLNELQEAIKKAFDE